MILIFTRQTDDTTIDMIRWIQSMGECIFRINSVNDIYPLQNHIEQNEIKGAYFNGMGLLRNKIETEDQLLQYQIENYLNDDAEIMFSYLFSGIPEAKVFGLMPYSEKINKLGILKEAERIGFLIPDFKLVSTRSMLIEAKKEWGRMICKSLGDGISIITGEVLINGQKTEEITSEDMEHFEERFYPTFVQKLIEKEFEVRVFYFNEKFYSIAIFSQSNTKSQIDGRQVDSQIPQRKIPFTIPLDLESKITALMKKTGLTYGSVDFIFSKDQKFYFLEVNPYGQYGFLSEAGNYYIEKEIAEFLCR